jgi:hypothetical protein
MSSVVIDKRCPICGAFMKQDQFGIVFCCSCPFKCFGEDYERVMASMSLNRLEVKQLLSYAEAREREGWYSGDKATFERRHESIKDKLLKMDYPDGIR